MQVAVTGATGFVGREVVRHLCEAGHSVRAVVRRASSRSSGDLTRQYRVALVEGDVINGGSLAGAFDGVAAVIHLVGIISEVGNTTFENAHTRGTSNALEASKKAGVGRFVHMSALGTRPGAASRYHQTKWQAEELVRNSGLDYTIFRPSLIYGPEDHFVNLFANMARWSPVLPVIGNGLTRFQPVGVEPVALAFSRALTVDVAVGKTFDLAGPERMTFLELLDTILRVLGKRRVKVKLPLPVVRTQAALLELIYPTLLGKAPPLNRDQITMLREDNVGEDKPANDLFGLRHLPFARGIAAYLGEGGKQ